jgi:predicted Holliday junction resolvase-like endonuclease
MSLNQATAAQSSARTKQPIPLLTWIVMALLVIVPSIGLLIGGTMMYRDWQRSNAAELAEEQERRKMERRREEREEQRFQQEQQDRAEKRERDSRWRRVPLDHRPY